MPSAWKNSFRCFEAMEIENFDKKEDMGATAAAAGIAKLKEVLAQKGSAY